LIYPGFPAIVSAKGRGSLFYVGRKKPFGFIKINSNYSAIILHVIREESQRAQPV
jgi:hypothetical protein